MKRLPLPPVKLLLFHLPADQQAALTELPLGTPHEKAEDDPRVEPMFATLTDVGERTKSHYLQASVNAFRQRITTRTAQPDA
jgi:hypothetical protein